MRPTPRPRFRNPAPAPVSRHPLGQTGAVGFGAPATPVFKPAPARSPLIAPSVSGAITRPAGVLPPDPAYDQAVSGINKQRDQAVAGLSGERDRTLLDAGYNVQYDANGNPLGDTLSFDPTNVFSRAAQLRKRWMEARTGTGNSMAARGQLNSGAYGRAQRQVNYGESQATDAELKTLQAFLARNSGQIAAAGTNAEIAAGGAMGERIGRIPTNPLYTPAPATPSMPLIAPTVGRAIKPKVKSKPKRGSK